jgi:hypothetical protein
MSEEKQVNVRRTITFYYSCPLSGYNGMTEDKIREFEAEMAIPEIIDILSGVDESKIFTTYTVGIGIEIQ